MERLTIRVPEEIKEGLERIQDAEVDCCKDDNNQISPGSRGSAALNGRAADRTATATAKEVFRLPLAKNSTWSSSGDFLVL